MAPAATAQGAAWRDLVKSAARGAAALSVLVHVLVYRAAMRLFGPRAFAWASQRASRWTGLVGIYRRRALLRLLGAEIAQDSTIELGTIFSKSTIVIGAGAYIGAYCCLGDVRIGEKAMLADGVCIPSGAHQHGTARLDIPMADQAGCYETVHIGRDCWIGSRAVVMADVGDGAIVAAGAVVVQRVEAATVVAGVPARPVSRR
jgi:acetyltransferase-like isoleucine patch superfamily enzyme